jgi:hypothetical protein
MRIDISHLVLVSFRHASNQVLDDRLDGAEGSNILARAVVDFDLNYVLTFGVLGEREGDCDVGEIFC